MFSMEELIVVVLCCVDDLWQEITQGQPIRQGGFTPALSDPEISTMEIGAEFLGICPQKQLWQYLPSPLADVVSDTQPQHL